MSEFLRITGEQKTAIAQAMARHTAPFVAAINVVGDDEWTTTGNVASARAWGTGNYIDLRGKPYILTNEHVAIARRSHSLAHALRHGSDPDNRAFRIINPFQARPHPIDAAISRIDDDVWRLAQRSTIPASRIARDHSPVAGERLFIQGFPGELTTTTSFLPGMHATPIAFLTEANELPQRFDRSNYFSVHYSPEWARTAGNKPFTLPQPDGFSGSLVWDTRYVRMRGTNWKPECAVITGLVCRWPKGHEADRLLAVRIEGIRAFLLQSLRLEAAYFRSLERLKVGGDQLDDWLWAERTIVDL